MSEQQQDQPGGAVALRDPDAPIDLIRREPIIDQLLATEHGRQTLALIKATVAQNANDAEVGMFLELCQHYGLDPFAKEAWCAKGQNANSKLLIMVGRDGLRKIARRQGLRVTSAVVCAGDEFVVETTEDGEPRLVLHRMGKPSDRGEIVGAWAMVKDPRGLTSGFFYAPLSEYMPTGNALNDYTPWKKQVSAMIMGAAERQAVRQATPLGGLLVEGEEATIKDPPPALTDGQGAGGPVGAALHQDVVDVLERAERVGHRGLADRAAAEMATLGHPDEVVRAWALRAHGQLDEVEPPEAEVVEPRNVAEEVIARLEDHPGARPDPLAEAGDALAEATGGQEGDLSAGEAAEPETPAESVDAPEAPQDEPQAPEYGQPTPEEQAAADALGQTIVSDDFLGDGPPRRATPRADPATLEDRAQAAMDAALAAEEEGHPDAAALMEHAEGLAAEASAAADPDQTNFDV